MFKRLMSVLIATAVIAAPLTLISTPAQAKTAKQMRDEQKGKDAKAKSAAKKVERAEKKKAKK